MNLFSFSFLLILALVLFELALLNFWRDEPIFWEEVIFNLNSSSLSMWLLRGIEVSCFAWVLAHANTHWIEKIPVIGQWIGAFILWDLSFYCRHWAHHNWSFLWAIHRVHHQGEHYGFSLGIRNSWYVILTAIFFILPLAMLGLPYPIYVTISSIHYAVQIFNHTALLGRCGWLDYVFVTPANHRLHHAKESRFANKNFGGTFLIWDKLFGTYLAPVKGEQPNLGVEEAHQVTSFNPLWASNPTLYQWCKKRLPTLMQSDLVINKVINQSVSHVVASAGILLFMLLIFYVTKQNDWNNAQAEWLKWVVLFYLISGTLVLGFIADRIRWALYFWCFLFIGSAFTVAPYFYIKQELELFIFMLLLAAQSCWSLVIASIWRRQSLVEKSE